MAVAAGILLGILGTGAGIAAQIDAINVTNLDDGFEINFDAVIDAPASQVYKVLADFTLMGKISPEITAVSVDPAPTGRGERVRSVIESCVLFFCRQIVQVEDVVGPDANTIVADIVPGAGDFKSGSTLWRLTDEGPRTRLHYETSRVAGFWIPPLIGPWAIKRTMREQLEFSIMAIESLAKGNPVCEEQKWRRTHLCRIVPYKQDISIERRSSPRKWSWGTSDQVILAKAGTQSLPEHAGFPPSRE